MSNDDRFTVDDHYSMGTPRKRSSGSGWVFGIVGCVVAAVFAPFLLVCGCCGGLMQWGMNEKGREILAAVEEDETFKAEIGERASATINWSDSVSAGTDVMVYDVSGENGSGQIYVHESFDVVVSIVLHKGEDEWDLNFDSEMLNEPEIDEEMAAAIEDDPAIKEQIGRVTKCQMDLGESIKEDDGVYVYNIVGDKGKGTITATFDDDQELISAKLNKDGQTFELKVKSPLGEITDEMEKL